MLATAAIEYLVSHGKSGAFGRFAAAGPISCERGQRVVIRSPRGLELGSVLCQATAGHAQLLGSVPVCDLLRPATADDESAGIQMELLGKRLFEDGRRLVTELNMPLEVIDVEVLLDGQQAIVQHLSSETINATPLVEALARQHHLSILLENLAVAPAGQEEEAEHGGCGKPDCGRNGGGNCTSCGDGCSSCGSGKVDMRAYFAHLRTKMENQQRRPLL